MIPPVESRMVENGPGTSGYRRSHLDRAHAATYDSHFLSNPLRSALWDLEQAALDDVIARFFKNRRIQAMDFACGTGRIAAFLEGRGAGGVAVDVSPAMLAVGRLKLRRFQVLQGDLTAHDVLGEQRFDLVTAFRFFPNAEPLLRTQALGVMVRHLAPRGYLVFNNHLNQGSLQQRLLRCLRRTPTAGLSEQDVRTLVAAAGLRIVRVYGIGLFPATERRLFLPRRLLVAFERLIFAARAFKSLSQDRLFVCQRERECEAARGSGRADG